MPFVYDKLQARRETNDIKKLSLDEESKLYEQIRQLKPQKRLQFCIDNQDFIPYLIKMFPADFWVNTYLFQDFLYNHYTPKLLHDLEKYRGIDMIDVTGMVCEKFNFVPKVLIKRCERLGKKIKLLEQSSITLFKLSNNKCYERLHKRLEYITGYQNSNSYFYFKNDKVYMSFRIYQNLDKIETYTDILNLHKYKKRCYICVKVYNGCKNYGKRFMCYNCAWENYTYLTKKTDFSTVIAYVSGCRHTVGYFTCLYLLRNGAKVIGSSRFPKIAMYNYSQEPDYLEFKDRLTVVYCDFTDIISVKEVIRTILPQINMYINNAFETVKPPQEYITKTQLLENQLGTMIEYSVCSKNQNILAIKGTDQETEKNQRLTTFLSTNDIAINNHKNIIVTHQENSWSQEIDQIPTAEILSNNVVNQITPTLIIQEVIKYFKQKENETCFLINVSSTEAYHTNGNHCITSMNKIAMCNMIHRMSISLPKHIKCCNADPGFVTGVYNNEKPLSSEDGAIRVLYPVIEYFNGNNLFTKDGIDFKNLRRYQGFQKPFRVTV